MDIETKEGGYSVRQYEKNVTECDRLVELRIGHFCAVVNRAQDYMDLTQHQTENYTG